MLVVVSWHAAEQPSAHEMAAHPACFLDFEEWFIYPGNWQDEIPKWRRRPRTRRGGGRETYRSGG